MAVRVSFIKLALRPIIYHHVFFTAVSQAVITKGNRFIPLGSEVGQRWMVEFTRRPVPTCRGSPWFLWELSTVELEASGHYLKWQWRSPDPLPGREVGISWQDRPLTPGWHEGGGAVLQA